jgi:hypothetical protein
LNIERRSEDEQMTGATPARSSISTFDVQRSMFLFLNIPKPSASRRIDPQILANLLHQQVMDFLMPWHGGSFVRSPVPPPGMVAAFPHQLTFLGCKMAQQGLPLHTSRLSSV